MRHKRSGEVSENPAEAEGVPGPDAGADALTDDSGTAPGARGTLTGRGADGSGRDTADSATAGTTGSDTTASGTTGGDGGAGSGTTGTSGGVGSGTTGSVAATGSGADTTAGKRALRRALLDVRAGLTPELAATAARELTRHALGLSELTAAGTVAAYVSVGREPGTRALLDALRARGVRVLLPVLLPDDDLDWAVYEGPERLARAGRGLLEPTGPRLGPGAVRGADAVLLPGLAVDGRGMRLGRGGGSYDRVLARLADSPVPPPLVVLLYANEVVDRVPAEAHDRPVHTVVTPDGVRRFAAPPGAGEGPPPEAEDGPYDGAGKQDARPDRSR